MKKSPNNNTQSEKAANKKYEYSDYYCVFSFKRRPVNIAFIEKLTQEYIDWANKTDSLVLSDFYNDLGITLSTFQGWLEKHECLSIAHKYAKRKVGNRREKGGLTKKLDSGMVERSMPMYEDSQSINSWTELKEWSTKLNEKEQDRQNQVVVMPIYPNSDIVPKKDNENGNQDSSK